MMLSSSAVDRTVAGLSPWLRTGSTPFDTTAEKPGDVLARRPSMRPQGLTTAKTVAKVSVVSHTAGEEEQAR
jgi:hypothetical protein